MATMVTDKALERVADSIDALAEKAKQALYSTSSASHMARHGLEGARESGRRFVDQAGEIAGDVMERSQQTAALVKNRVEQQPYMTLLIVGMAVGLVGMMIGWLVRGR